MNQGLSIHPSFFLPLRLFLSGSFCGICSLFFSETQYGVRALCVDRSRVFLKKFFCPQNEENGPKMGFFGFIGKFSQQFFLNLVYKESLYYLLYSCTNPILGKNLVPGKKGQNALGQSDCRIFKLTIAPEHKDEKA